VVAGMDGARQLVVTRGRTTRFAPRRREPACGVGRAHRDFRRPRARAAVGPPGGGPRRRAVRPAKVDGAAPSGISGRHVRTARGARRITRHVLLPTQARSTGSEGTRKRGVQSNRARGRHRSAPSCSRRGIPRRFAIVSRTAGVGAMPVGQPLPVAVPGRVELQHRRAFVMTFVRTRPRQGRWARSRRREPDRRWAGQLDPAQHPPKDRAQFFPSAARRWRAKTQGASEVSWSSQPALALSRGVAADFGEHCPGGGHVPTPRPTGRDRRRRAVAPRGLQMRDARARPAVGIACANFSRSGVERRGSG